MPSPRSLITYFVALVVVFSASAAIGYVYERDPERDLVEVVIDRSALPEREAEFASGTVVELDGGTAVVVTGLNRFDVNLDEVAIEELRPLEDPSGFAEGATLNLGGERTPVERVISGVVLFAPEVTQ